MIEAPGAMNEHTLIQVVPQLKPTRCGVSDHAIALADKLRASFGIESVFVVLNSEERCEIPYRTVYCHPAKLRDAAHEMSQGRADLLVHVSGYGYSRDGAPDALADALEAMQDSGRVRPAAYFHELYFTGLAPWKKAFWYSNKQRRAVARIAHLCTLVLTNTAQHANWLQANKSTETALKILPVFSTSGECAEPPAWDARTASIIVFGQSDTRRRAYKRLAHMGETIRRLGLQDVIDIGAEADVPQSVAGVPVRRMGRLPAEELGKVISSARFGFVRFRPNEAAKSSVMASLCAFGAVPVLADSFAGEIDGISDGKQVITPETVATAVPEECSRAAWTWYQQHNVDAHARVYSEWMANETSRELVAR